jgi:transcription initiation factor TFIIF subunit beta
MEEEAKHLETARADRSVWLMKCPTVVSRAWQDAATSAASSSSAAAEAGSASPNPNPVVAKVVLSLDPLRDDQPLQASFLPHSGLVIFLLHRCLLLFVSLGD